MAHFSAILFRYAFLVLMIHKLLWAVEGEANPSSKLPLPIHNWLSIGPISAPLPALHNSRGKSFPVKDLLEFKEADIENWWPSQGLQFKWDHKQTFTWTKIAVDTDGVIHLPMQNTRIPIRTYLATYLDVKRWIQAELFIKTSHLLKVYLDGEAIVSKSKSSNPDNPEGYSKPEEEIKHILKLETGKHLLLLKALYNPHHPARWTLQAHLLVDSTYGRKAIAITLSPMQRMNLHHLLDHPRIIGVSISPDGGLATITIQQAQPPTDQSETWLELRRVKDGRLVQTFRGGPKISSVRWAPQGRRFSYIVTEKEEGTLWVVNLEKGTSTPLLKKIKNLEDHTWSPDGTFIVYSVTEKPVENRRGVKRFQSLRDRWPWWRNRKYLYRVNVPQGTRQRLTAGDLTTELSTISPDGKSLIFKRDVEDLTHRPYEKTELFVLDLISMELDTLWTGYWFESAQWSPDGTQLLLTGGPSMFGKLGINLPENMIPNEFDTQAYLFDLKTHRVVPVSRQFHPDIVSAHWNHTENAVYFIATDGEYRRLYRYDLKTKDYRVIDTGVEVLNSLAFARKPPLAVYYGSSAASPHQAFAIDLKKKRYWLLSDPARASFKHVKLGKVERWTFKTARGKEIEGRIYYPPDFHPQQKYPLIVYYYGGVNSTVRSFGGRYPKNLFASQGYVVYVLEPSGATGYGQAFSARHVNDWGKVVSKEIITGVQQFIRAHPFIDEKRVGGIGASYGGFMTMLLLTQTDLFAAAVAHAGISSISSYWGEGYWGYLYSAYATANSFPWNRKDIYVEQSPLFQANRVNTPLLLLHGSADTNVPPGESTQFFTALKLLGKPVEYVQVFDQNHWIVNYHKRIIWQKTILAWFDRWLKDQPQWWEELYPAK